MGDTTFKVQLKTILLAFIAGGNNHDRLYLSILRNPRRCFVPNVSFYRNHISELLLS